MSDQPDSPATELSTAAGNEGLHAFLLAMDRVYRKLSEAARSLRTNPLVKDVLVLVYPMRTQIAGGESEQHTLFEVYVSVGLKAGHNIDWGIEIHHAENSWIVEMSVSGNRDERGQHGFAIRPPSERVTSDPGALAAALGESADELVACMDLVDWFERGEG